MTRWMSQGYFGFQSFKQILPVLREQYSINLLKMSVKIHHHSKLTACLGCKEICQLRAICMIISFSLMCFMRLRFINTLVGILGNKTTE